MPTDFRQQVTTLDEFWKHKHPAELIAAKKLEKISASNSYFHQDSIVLIQFWRH